MGVLRVGDTVSWRGSWGRDLPQDVKVNGIEVNCVGKSGTEVQEVEWDFVDNRSVIVDLDNGHWAYGNQISEKNSLKSLEIK